MKSSSTLSASYTQPEVSSTSPVDIIYEFDSTPPKVAVIYLDLRKSVDSVDCAKADYLSDDR
jgi:hypothetical protein